jgi:Uma2 family endonuclease
VEKAPATMPARILITDEDLRRLPRDGRKYELVDGEIRVGPAGGRHGQITLALGARILAHVGERGLGMVLDSSTGFRLAGRTPGHQDVRSPDLGFVAAGRLPGDRAPVGFVELAPDLAVEVLSPDDRPREVLEKVGEFLGAGTRLVWVLDPERRSAAVYRSLVDVRRLEAHEALDGEEVIPGFSCPLRDLFA